MSIVTGGILGRVAGKTGGIIFGSARSREGKVNTAREFVKPSNPKTVDQVAQRNLFKRTLVIVKGIGPDYYQVDFNRAVQQLPGFQSWMSILLSNVDVSDEFTAPGDTPLGALHFPGTWSLAEGAFANSIKVTWSTELGANGTAADPIRFACFAVAATTTVQYGFSTGEQERSDGVLGATISDLSPGEDYVCVGWLLGAGTADGLISKARWGIINALT